MLQPVQGQSRLLLDLPPLHTLSYLNFVISQYLCVLYYFKLMLGVQASLSIPQVFHYVPDAVLLSTCTCTR